MPCEHPLEAYRALKTGSIHFKRPQEHTYEKLEIPCGHCILCREEQARQMAVRITHEAQMHEFNSFVTATYDDKHLPKDGGLNYKDLNHFWRRLKRAYPGIRFYAVGEYGDLNNRPHYHLCVFGQAFLEKRFILRETPTMLWTTRELIDIWGKGHVSVGALNFTTAQYTAGYMAKKLVKNKQYVRLNVETGELVPLEQPRAFSSKHPAIGKRWLEKFGDQVYAWDQVVINGKAQKPPKYYDRWLKERSEIALQMITDQRKEKAKPITSEQRRARARNAHARAKARKKTI